MLESLRVGIAVQSSQIALSASARLANAIKVAQPTRPVSGASGCRAKVAERFEAIEPALRHLASEVLCDVSSQLQDTIRLIQQLAELYPAYGQAELLRMALLLTLHPLGSSEATQWCHAGEQWSSDSQAASSPARTEELLWHSQAISLRLSAAGDQHAALAEELDSLAATAPCDFSPEHLFALARAIRVQSRMLDLYLGAQPVLQDQAGYVEVDHDT